MRWFPFINLTLAALIVAALFGTVFLAIPNQEPWTPPQNPTTLKELPKSGFDSSCLEGFHKGPFALEWNEPKMQLPDLNNELLYYGFVQRPDIPVNQKLVHLSIQGQERIEAFDLSEPVYLLYNGAPLQDATGRIFTQRGDALSSYSFSPENLPTTLWLEFGAASATSLQIIVNMLDEHGDLISSPISNHSFHLTSREIPRLKQMGWELDGTRVDSTLLIRQKARWVGQDLFLEEHGGEEFASTWNKERIDFGQEESYSCFVSVGTQLVWQDHKWQPVEGQTTVGLPLLVVKKVEERLISFELWDPEGRGKTLMTLVRAKDLHGLPNLDEEFKFIGAKTWAKFIVESHNERLILQPHDWLVLTEEGWISLSSPELIDDFVENRLQGPLLILDKLIKQNGKQVLTGQLFNTSRTEVEAIELSTTSNSSLANSYSMPPTAPLRQNNQFDFEDDLE
ncbi:MAG: hypothetical protein K0U13_00075 [Chlamydiae bacterium]|nr:hypothetical protein [Chlamydiota bacterium]